MEKILVFKTSTDATIKRLFQELGEKNIDCLIQSSQIGRYRTEYPHINFIDICQEGFYDLPPKVIAGVSERAYDQLYITFSGIKGHNYGNVMKLVNEMNFKSGFFYNCNGDRVEIPKRNIIKDAICRLYIGWIGFIYGLRGE